MKKVKILWATALGLLYVVVVSFISAIIVDTNSTFYITLNKPSFMPSGIVFSIIWGIVYLFLGITFTEMFAKNPQLDVVISYIFLGLNNFIYLFSFFRLYSTIAGLIFCITGAIISFYLLCRLSKLKIYSSFLFLFIFSWYLFASILSYYIVIMN